MTLDVTLKMGVRLLAASLFAAFIASMWPLAANAKGSKPARVVPQDIKFTKTVDKASPSLAKAKGKQSKSKSGIDLGGVEGESTRKDHKGE